MDYKKAGVDIEAGYKSVELMKEHVKRTMREEVLGGLGGFSGAFSLKKIKDMDDPVLLSGTDGCGTKVKLAMILDKHDTIGIDAVAMCVNDIACAGGEPLFFLDYIACGKNYPEKIAEIVSGVAEGCVQSDAALIGGETAEHPGLMPEEDYDLAGFAVGVCDRKDLITGENLIYRFCRLDKARFGEIKNVTDRLYYTNSYHVHVCEEIDAFSKLKFESQFHDISLGGCISYIEVPDMSKNIEAVEDIINFIYHNIQYAEINTKPDICYKCGYTGEIQLNKGDLTWHCPSCGNSDENEMQVMRRTCGYIGTNFWNKGRTAEIGDRVLHL